MIKEDVIVRKEKRTKLIRRGDYIVEVEIEVVYPKGIKEACLDAPTLKRLHEITQRAERGDLNYLRSVGRVYRAIPADEPAHA